MTDGSSSTNQRSSRADKLRQQVQDPDIRKVFDAVLPEVLEIADKELGKGYLTKDSFELPSGIAYYALESNVVTGFAACRIENSEEFLDAHPLLAKRAPPGLFATERFGLLTTVVVRDYYQARGFGTALTAKCVRWMDKNEDIPFMVMTAWKSSTGIHIAKVARRTGFMGKFEVPDYWAKDSVRNDYQCPDCGAPPCHCSAAVFMKDFSRQNLTH